MNLLKNVFGRILAIWALLSFVVPMLVILIPVWLMGMIKEPKRTDVFLKLSRLWLKVFFLFSGVRRKYVGLHHFKKGATYIVVCNHSSFIDAPLCSAGIPGAHKTIAKIEMSKIPLFGLIYKSGSVLVDRKNNESKKSSFLKMKEILSLGMHMCIYPEGTRNKTDKPLQPFHDGAFKLATDRGNSIIPALIFNSKNVMPRHKSFYFWPQKIEMHFLEPVHTIVGESYQSLKERVFTIMQDYYLRKIS